MPEQPFRYVVTRTEHFAGKTIFLSGWKFFKEPENLDLLNQKHGYPQFQKKNWVTQKNDNLKSYTEDLCSGIEHSKQNPSTSATLVPRNLWPLVENQLRAIDVQLKFEILKKYTLLH